MSYFDGSLKLYRNHGLKPVAMQYDRLSKWFSIKRMSYFDGSLKLYRNLTFQRLNFTIFADSIFKEF